MSFRAPPDGRATGLRIADLRPMYPIGHIYDVSPKGEIVYVQFKPGKQELWLMDFLNR